MGLVLLFISAALVNNFILIRFLGICPFMGVSKTSDTAIGMSISVLFVMTVASVITWLVNKLLLVPYELGYMQTVIFILIIASLVQFVEMVIEKTSPELYTALGIFLPLITTNCAILGVVLINISMDYDFFKMLVFTLGSGVGFGLSLILFSGLRGRLEYADVPEAFKNGPEIFIMAGILAMAFMGFVGIG